MQDTYAYRWRHELRVDLLEGRIALLRGEGVELDERIPIVRGGLRLIASTSTRIVCYPTCPIARRTSAANRVEFATLLQST